MKSFLIDNFTAVHLKKLVEKAREAYANERAVERQIAKLRDQIQLFADEYAAPGEPVLKEPPAKLTGSIWQLKLRREEFAQKKAERLARTRKNYFAERSGFVPL